MPLAIPFEFTNGVDSDATQVNANFDAIESFVNGLEGDIQTLETVAAGLQADVAALEVVAHKRVMSRPSASAVSISAGTSLVLTYTVTDHFTGVGGGDITQTSGVFTVSRAGLYLVQGTGVFKRANTSQFVSEGHVRIFADNTLSAGEVCGGETAMNNVDAILDAVASGSMLVDLGVGSTVRLQMYGQMSSGITAYGRLSMTELRG